MTFASILKVVLPYVVGAILGAVICYSVMPEPEVPEPEIQVEYDTLKFEFRDTVWIPPITVIETQIDTHWVTPEGNIKSEVNYADDRVGIHADIYSPCYIDSILWDITFAPRIIEREKMVVSIDSIKTYTIQIKPPWYKTWLVGFVEGVVLVAGSVYLAGQL